jgi:hypothetical protein
MECGGLRRRFHIRAHHAIWERLGRIAPEYESGGEGRRTPY